MDRSNRMKFITQKRATLKILITSLLNAVDNDRLDGVNLRLRFQRLTEHFKTYEDLHDALVILDPDDNHLDDMFEIQDRYYNLATKIETIVPTILNDATSSSHTSSVQVESIRQIKLPVAELPKFSGDIEHWISYKNTFITMIDSREDITNLQKFLYLKASLKGDALNKISIYSASDSNYELAWKLITESYEKKRILISRHLDAIIDMPRQIQANGLELSKLVDNLRQHKNMLAALDVNPDEHLLIRILERSLPRNIRSKWEETLTLDNFPTLDQLYNFMSETAFRLCTLEKENSHNKTGLPTKRSLAHNEQMYGKVRTNYAETRALVTMTTSNICPVCQGEGHIIHRCPVYNALTIEQRVERVKKLNLCRNCLHYHDDRCRSRKCIKCNQFHHTSLHLRDNTFQTPNKMISTESHKVGSSVRGKKD
ncbi:uncharacterized protein [Prorops nasuta]|uniref:uncharacterized protein n=1 Tax=Prorops nasuta TaxID=863751 RepID=UPI0034D01BFB